MIGFNVGLVLLLADDRIAPHAIASTFRGTGILSSFVNRGMGDVGGDTSTTSSMQETESAVIDGDGAGFLLAYDITR